MGLLEAPSIPLAVVNVGSRQRGRTAARNVLFVDANEIELRNGITRARSDEFRERLTNLVNPYGDGRTSARVVDILSRGIDPLLTDKPFDPLRSHD
jgi:UDP-N-acetylglucosamine 2-epimerase